MKAYQYGTILSVQAVILAVHFDVKESGFLAAGIITALVVINYFLWNRKEGDNP